VAVNSDKPFIWDVDISQSIDMYNDWFIKFAPQTYHENRARTTALVENALKWTNNLTNIAANVLRQHPDILPMLRMTTAPPIARDRLVGLTGVSKNLVGTMETKGRFPPGMSVAVIDMSLQRIGQMIIQLADRDIFTWLGDKHVPSEIEIYRAATIVADRLCGAATDPIVRNAQEQRQLASLKQWLEQRGYTQVANITFNNMRPGTFSFRLNVPVLLEDGNRVNIPVDAVIMPHHSKVGDFPLLIEAKSAGDFTNTNKRRKEEATKFSQLKRNYGKQICFVMLLCGYFDTGYLKYEAAEGIDWIWEHRIDDLAKCGV
jgi:hypothetical protein